MKYWIRFLSQLKKLSQPKRPFKLTPGGWVFILYTIGVGAGAINTGNNLLYLIFGLFLGFIMASGVLSDTDLWRVDVEWHFPEAAEARKRCSIPLSITNKKTRIPSLSITVALEGALNGRPCAPAVFVPSVLPGENILREATFVPERRGFYKFERARLYTRFPFGLLRKQWTVWTGENEGFYVYPALFPLSEADYAGFLAGNEELSVTDRRGEGTTISGLRAFTPDDSARRIHWKASAKHGNLFVRETDLDKKRDVEIFWPTWTMLENLGNEIAEEFIEFTASLVWGFEQRGHGVRFFANEAEHVEAPMEYLSMVDLAAPAPAAGGNVERAAGATGINSWEAYQEWKKGR